MSKTTVGGLYALAAYGTWGLSPIFWRYLTAVPPLELLAHRVLWAMVLFFLLLRLRGRAGELAAAFRQPRLLLPLLATAALVGCNWYLYVWAVTNGRVLEASLGYFINPLLNVVLGTLFLGERPRPWQWVAVALATAGVVHMTASADGVPWIGLTLAATFGLYGLVRKTALADALLGTSIETILVGPFALVFLLATWGRGTAVWPEAPTSALALLPATGAITALPLLWFSNAARRLPLTTLGFFQYLGPTGQFLLAVFAFGEPFSRSKLVSFVMIWTALALFTAEAQVRRRRREPSPQPLSNSEPSPQPLSRGERGPESEP